MTVGAELLRILAGRGWSLACAESLTGGLLTSAVVDTPGASLVLRGGVVAYDTEIKRSVLGVDAELLEREGAVDPDVAQQMAEGVRRALRTSHGDADVGLATTGVAGPEPQDGKSVGTVFIAVATPAGTHVRQLALAGSREDIRRATVDSVLTLAVTVMTDESPHGE